MRGRFVAVAAVLSMALAASCGDDDASDGESAGTEAGSSATEAPTGAGGSGGSAPSGGGEECTPERAGGEITAMTGTAVSGLDPTLTQGSGARGGDAYGAFYGAVIRYDATTDTYHPAIAESWESNEAHTKWTLKLRDDVTFGNGDPFTTRDIAANIERLKGTAVWGGGMARLVTDIEIVDDHEMVVTMEAPFDFRYIMSTQVGWVPNRKLVDERGEGFHANPKGGGAGPFEFASMSAAEGESLVLEAKDDWWGGAVCLDEIEFTYAEEYSTQSDALRNGEVDTLFVGNQEQAADLEAEGLMAYQIPVGAMGYITANQGFEKGEKTKFDDVRIREAMQLAVDYDILYERLFSGKGPKPTSAIVPEGSALYAGVEGPPYDPERASELVQETIDEGVWDGSLTFTYTPLPDQEQLAVALQGMWEAVGMDVTLDPSSDAITRVIVDRNFEVASLGFGIVPPEPWSSLNALECGTPRSRSGFCDPDMDAALTAVKEAYSLEEKRETMKEVQEVWNETYPLVVYRHGTFGYAAQSHVHGLEFGSNYMPYFGNAWVEE